MRYGIFSDDVCPILNIGNIGYADDPAVTRFGAGARNEYIIHYVLAGKGYFNGNPVCANQGFLITPHMQECYYPDEETPWEFLWVVSNDEKMATVFELFHADRDTHIFEYTYAQAVRELAAEVVERNNAVVSSFESAELFLRIFKYQQEEKRQCRRKSNAEIYVESAVKYIQSNLHTPLSVAELTAFLGVSQPYVFTLFKSRFQMSPKEYILNQKCKRAQTLLEETTLSVAHVAHSVGFQDALSFSKFFKSRTGVSPQAYRIERR